LATEDLLGVDRQLGEQVVELVLSEPRRREVGG